MTGHRDGSNPIRVRILGCGPAGGVPSISGGWGNCDPAEPRNRRRRASILVRRGATTVLVDTSPDLRQQLLDAGVDRLDAVLYTHAHADHILGIDDLREINRVIRRGLPIYGDAATMRTLTQRFDYCFQPLDLARHSIFRPWLEAHEATGPVPVGSLIAVPFEQDHGVMATVGWRFGPLAYSTDVVTLPESAFAALEGVDTWIVGVLTDRPHPTHAHVDKALAWIYRVKPRLAVLTHLGLSLDYRALQRELPDGVIAAHDGLTLVVPV